MMTLRAPVPNRGMKDAPYSQTHDVCEHNCYCILSYQNHEAPVDFLLVCNSSCVHKCHAFASSDKQGCLASGGFVYKIATTNPYSSPANFHQTVEDCTVVRVLVLLSVDQNNRD